MGALEVKTFIAGMTNSDVKMEQPPGIAIMARGELMVLLSV